jgi:hypothetical protein
MLRRFSVVTATGLVRQLGATFRSERFTLQSVTAPGELARQLAAIASSIEDVYRAIAANPSVGAIMFESLEAGSAGQELAVTHRLGHVPSWRVVGWRNAGAGHSFVEVSRDENTLVLASYVSGRVDLEVF